MLKAACISTTNMANSSLRGHNAKRSEVLPQGSHVPVPTLLPLPALAHTLPVSVQTNIEPEIRGLRFGENVLEPGRTTQENEKLRVPCTRNKKMNCFKYCPQPQASEHSRGSSSIARPDRSKGKQENQPLDVLFSFAWFRPLASPPAQKDNKKFR